MIFSRCRIKNLVLAVSTSISGLFLSNQDHIPPQQTRGNKCTGGGTNSWLSITHQAAVRDKMQVNDGRNDKEMQTSDGNASSENDGGDELTIVGLKKNVSFEKLKKWIPNAKVDTEEKASIKKAAQIDKEHVFKCSAPRGIYSNNAVGTANGPSKEDITFLELKLENGYICGSALPFDAHGKFFVKRQLRCGDFIEYQVFNPPSGSKGGR
eukprot:2273722-Ditylum_brightwellii.AAC.1